MLIRKNFVLQTQTLLCQGTSSHGVSKKHPNRLVHNFKYRTWACHRISGFLGYGFLGHGNVDKAESKVCCRAGQTEPRLLLENAQATLSRDMGGAKPMCKVQPLFPWTGFHGVFTMQISHPWRAEEGMAGSLLPGANTNYTAAKNHGD